MSANEKSHPELIHYSVAANRDIENPDVAAVVLDMSRKRKHSEINGAGNIDGGEAIAEPATSETEHIQTHVSSSEFASDGSHGAPQGALEIVSLVLGGEEDGNGEPVSFNGLVKAPTLKPHRICMLAWEETRRTSIHGRLHTQYSTGFLL